MPAQSRLTHIQHMVLMMVVAVVGWAVFLGLFLLIFTDSYEPSVSRTVWWVWLVVGTIVTVITMFVCFRVLQTPRQWRSSAAIALFAPAMCLDALTTTYFNDWFDQGIHDNTAYSALILGAASICLLVAMVVNKPTADKSSLCAEDRIVCADSSIRGTVGAPTHAVALDVRPIMRTPA